MTRTRGRQEMKCALRLTLCLVLLSVIFFPRAAYASDARCADTLIASPASGSTQSGLLVITGRAQLEGAFTRYQVDFSTSGLDLWVLINSAPQAVVDGTLARWDTSLVPEGKYDVRVRSVDTSGNYCEAYARSVSVKNPGRVSGLVSPSAVQENPSNAGGSPASLPSSLITIPSLNGTLGVEVPQVPNIPYCTPSLALGTIVTRSVRLCAGQSYRPFAVVGNNIVVLGDANRTAKIQSAGRGFGITVRGSNVLISGVNIVGAPAPQDTGSWLCLYEQCLYKNQPVAGGINYGGGILLQGSNNTVMNSRLSGGVIGIASLNGRGSKLLNNELSGLSGWGIFAVAPVNSAFVGNVLQDINRSCTDPGGRFFAGGCESAGVLLMGADANIIANNTCARSGNCFYLNGEGGRLNNFNKLYGNLCSAPSFNCFEITDAQGIEFDNNRATLAPDNTSGCEIWLVRAQIIAGKNNHVPLCNHRGSKLDSVYDPPKPRDP